MSSPLTQKTAEQLYQELLLLRKGRGFTPERLKRAHYLIGFLGGTQAPYEHLRERFVSAINSLHDPEPALLRAIYGLDQDTESLPSLKQRRIRFGQMIQRGHETVADLEPAALEHLRAQIVTGWYPLSPMDFRIPTSHNGVIFEDFQVSTIVHNMRWFQTRFTMTFVAAFDELDYVSIVRDSPGIIADINRDFTVKTQPLPNGSKVSFVHVPGPMKRGKIYNIDVILRPEPNTYSAEILTEESMAFHEPARTARFEVRFIGTQPLAVYALERLSPLELGTGGSPLQPQQEGLYIHGATNLYGGLYFGIRWD